VQRGSRRDERGDLAVVEEHPFDVLRRAWELDPDDR